MTYTLPPEMVSSGFNTNAVVNTATTHTLVAANATQRFRIYALRFAINQAEAVANVFRLFVVVRGTNAWATVLQLSVLGSDGEVFPSPGLQLGTNEALTITSFCTAVTRPFTAMFQIYRDEIT
jgi:hypothetical protein